MEEIKRMNKTLGRIAVSGIEEIKELDLTDVEEMKLFLKLRELARLTTDILAEHSKDRA